MQERNLVLGLYNVKVGLICIVGLPRNFQAAECIEAEYGQQSRTILTEIQDDLIYKGGLDL